MEIVIAVAMFVVGIIVGIMIANKHNKPIGTLRIDQSDPDEAPYLFLELSEDPMKLMSSTYVTLKVNAKNYISHK